LRFDTSISTPLQGKAFSHISLATLYEEGTTTRKRKIIGSIFFENITFDGIEFRATINSEAL